MRARFRWVGVAVVLSSGVGVAAALVEAPVPVSGASGISRPVAPVVAPDFVTPQVRALASEALQLGQEITSAQRELIYLEHEVAYESTLSHVRWSTPPPTLSVALSTGGRSRDDRGASSTSAAREGTAPSGTVASSAVASGTVTTSSVSSTTIVEPTTTLAPATTTSCTPSYADAAPAIGVGCPTGSSNDD